MSFANGKRSELQAVSDERLYEAVERVDQGWRLALPELADALGVDSEQESAKNSIDHETATVVGAKLLDARKALMEAGVALPLGGQMDIHLALNSMVNEVDRLTGELADRWGSE